MSCSSSTNKRRNRLILFFFIAITNSFYPATTTINAFVLFSHTKCRQVTTTVLAPTTALPQRLQCRQSAIPDSSDDVSNNDINNNIGVSSPESSSQSFLIREIREDDIVVAAKILADSFLKDSGGSFLNFFTKKLERMDIYLSLKSRFETFRFADRSGSLQCILVAYYCDKIMVTDDDDNGDGDGKEVVIAICEVDNRPPGDEIDPAPRPYISNLAVDTKFRRMGTATALIKKSEDIVRGWDKPRLHLQVYDDNVAAKEMYTQKCGYEIQSTRMNAKKETILLLGKDI
jgi:ribosomal protein S18 acetylase RimI-like enzyme